MDLENLRYEVQRIDGSPDSITRAMDLIINEYENTPYLPKSIEFGFFEEFTKCIIDWIGKGEDKSLSETFKSLGQAITSDKDYISPFAGSTSKRRFGAQLHIMKDFIEIYLRSDLAIKDENHLSGSDKKSTRLRLLLWNLLSDKVTVNVSTVHQFAMYREKVNIKTCERDLNDLAIWGFLKKRAETPKKISYELTNKARFYKDKIEELVNRDQAISLSEHDHETVAFSQHTEKYMLAIAQHRVSPEYVLAHED